MFVPFFLFLSLPLILILFDPASIDRAQQKQKQKAETERERDISHPGTRRNTQRERKKYIQGQREKTDGNMKRMMPIVATLICVMMCALNGVYAAEYLYVQTGTGATLNGMLTMTGVTTKMSFFADRPVRVAGIMTTDEFLTLFEPSATFDEVRIHLPQLCVCVSSSPSSS